MTVLEEMTAAVEAITQNEWSTRQGQVVPDPEDLRLGNDAVLRQLTRTVDKVTEQLDDNLADQRRAQPVRIVPPRATPMERLQDSV